MKKVVTKGCGEWRKATEPFNSQPFQGKYAREGAKGEMRPARTSRAPRSLPATTRPARPPRRPTTSREDNGGNGGNGGNGNDDTGFDPGAYETQPQGDPGNGGTQAPNDG